MKKLIISCVIILVVLLSVVSGVGCGPTPASVSLSNLRIEPQHVHPNETVTISVSVANIGNSQGSYNVVLNINGVQEEAKSVTMAAGDSKSVTFSVIRENVGSYTVTVDGLSGSFTVTQAEAELPSAQEIVDGIIASFNNIRTYQYDMDETINMTVEVEGEVSESTFALGGSGTVDFENRQMRMEHTIESIPKTGQPELVWGGEQYFIDGMLYTKPKIPGEEPMWMKEEAPEEWWETQQMELVDSQIELLGAAQVEVIGSESVGGIDCYVLEVTPDLEQLWQLFNYLIFQEAPDVTEEYLQEVFRSFSVKQWVAKDTYFLMKAEIDISTEFPPGEPGPSTIDIAMVLLAYNYNQPVSIVLPPEAEEASEEAEVNDENLEIAIRDALGKPMGMPITTAELAGLTILEADESGIADLSGLEYCTSLNVLDLWGNQISDITPLENLTSLNVLNLFNNQISDITPLENLTSLKVLELSDNQISDITPLENLTSLNMLDLSDNQISDITPLENLTSLNMLELGNNQISDITPLVENSGLGTGDEVWLEDNNLDLSQGSEDMENIRALEDRGVLVRY